MLKTEPMKYLNSGIYMIVNKVNNKRYIGQAVDLIKRKREHLSGKKSNIPLQRAIEKYGIENFEFIVLEYLPKDKEILTKAEQKWLDFYKDNGKWHRLYNILPTAETFLGHKRTAREGEITRLRNSKAVYQFDLSGNFIKEWSSAVEVEKALGFNNTHIFQCRTKTRRTCNGFLWLSSKEESVIKEAVAVAKSAIIRSDSVATIMCDKNTGEAIKRFESIRSAEIFLGLSESKGKIKMVMNGERKSAHGYDWKFA